MSNRKMPGGIGASGRPVSKGAQVQAARRASQAGANTQPTPAAASARPGVTPVTAHAETLEKKAVAATHNAATDAAIAAGAAALRPPTKKAPMLFGPKKGSNRAR